jgi:hypothetical protein
MPRTHSDDWFADIEKKSPSRDASNRWTPLLVAEGWTSVSNVFLRLYSKLNPPLSYGEAMFVIHLVQYKWDESAPYPSLTTIADRMAVSAGTARSFARSLERKGYLRREEITGKANKYHLDPLFKALEDAWMERQSSQSESRSSQPQE